MNPIIFDQSNAFLLKEDLKIAYLDGKILYLWKIPHPERWGIMAKQQIKQIIQKK